MSLTKKPALLLGVERKHNNNMADSQHSSYTCVRSLSLVRKYNVSGVVCSGGLGQVKLPSPKLKHSAISAVHREALSLKSVRLHVDSTGPDVEKWGNPPMTRISNCETRMDEVGHGAMVCSCCGQTRIEAMEANHSCQTTAAISCKTHLDVDEYNNTSTKSVDNLHSTRKNTLLNLKLNRRRKSFHGRENCFGGELQMASQLMDMDAPHNRLGVTTAVDTPKIRRAVSLDSGSHSEPNSSLCQSAKTLPSHHGSLTSPSDEDLSDHVVQDQSMSDSGVVSPRGSVSNLDQVSAHSLTTTPIKSDGAPERKPKEQENENLTVHTLESPLTLPTEADAGSNSGKQQKLAKSEPEVIEDSSSIGIILEISDGDPHLGISEPISDPWNIREEDAEDTDDDWDEFEPQAPVTEEASLFEMGSLVMGECDVCLDIILHLNLRLCCQAMVCNTCMDTYIRTEVVDNGHIKIKCPAVNCKSFVHRDEVVCRLAGVDKEKFYRFLVQANNKPNIKTCPRCSNLTTVELSMLQDSRVKKQGLQTTCPECSLNWCFSCQAPFHQGITCKEHRRGDKLLKKWAKERICGQPNAQKCPKCNVLIQRTAGCDHMTCTRCDTNFCYRCGDRYLRIKFIGDHHSRFSILGCKYIFSANNTTNRRLVRGSIFGGKVLVAPLLGILALGAGAVVLCGAILSLPFYGCHLLKKWKKAQARRKAVEAWKARLSQIHNAGDPYLENWNHFTELGINMHHLNTQAREREATYLKPPNNDTDDSSEVEESTVTSVTVDCHLDSEGLPASPIYHQVAGPSGVYQSRI